MPLVYDFAWPDGEDPAVYVGDVCVEAAVRLSIVGLAHPIPNRPTFDVWESLEHTGRYVLATTALPVFTDADYVYTKADGFLRGKPARAVLTKLAALVEAV